MTRLAALLGLGAVLVATRGRADWSGVGGRDVPLQGDGKTWTVRATLNGSVEGQFLLDTGATYCVISQNIARRLALRPSGERLTLVTANGQVSAPLVTIRYFDLGSNRARDVKAVVHDSVGPPLDGILGLSFLNNFAYVIDAKQRIVRLRPGG
jgi:clan AA aspartic protease (TIGR02281 family)